MTDYPRCAAPGCNRQILASSITGCCREHNHATDICRCGTCSDRRRRKASPEALAALGPPAPPVERYPGTVVVEVPYAGSSGQFTPKAPVRLLAAPWEDA